VRTTTGLFVAALFFFLAPVAAQSVPDAVEGEVIAAIQVHGNTLTPSEDLIKAAGLAVGSRVTDASLREAESRLRAAITLESAEVLKRFASISDPTQILVLIQVDEGPVRIDVPRVPGQPGAPTVRRVVRRSRFNMMFLPILDAEDGYGLTYGAQFAFAGHRATRRRVIVPASWGGDKRIAAEFQQEFAPRSAPRLRAGAMLQRRTHPFFDENADRKRVWARSEFRIHRDVRAGAELAWQSSSLAGEKVEARSVGGDVIVDTRVDPLMPHNAIFVRSAVERLHFSSSNTAVRTEIDATGSVGIYRGTILAVRVQREDFSRPAPAFYKSMLGGSRNLRGFRAGHAIGDTVVAGSAELRIPTNSPLRMARFGVSVFMDAGTAYNKGQRFDDQELERGVGAGVWATAPLFRLSVAVARGIGSGWRAHIGAGLTF
jgi:outer membrane protein assembly factor BamA